MKEWISVKDRLPPYEKTVLVYYKDPYARFPDKDSWVYTGYLDLCNDKPKWDVEDMFDVVQELVTHWMPLPEMPEN